MSPFAFTDLWVEWGRGHELITAMSPTLPILFV